jgi:hypothetical protein
MGIDLYVRWDDMTSEEYAAQITGYADAPEVGYLRYNWNGARFASENAVSLGLPIPIPHYHFGTEDDLDIAGIKSELREYAASCRGAAILSELITFENDDGKVYFIEKLNAAAVLCEFALAKHAEGKANVRIEFR